MNESTARIVMGAEEYDGLMVTWCTSGLADFYKIYDALENEFGSAFADKYSPEMPSEALCLRKAVQALGKQRYNLDNLKQGVWAISLREKTTDNSVGVKYMPELKVHVQAGSLVFSDTSHELCETVRIRYEQIRASIPSENIRSVVSKYFKAEADSVAMRRAGGVEYVPAKNCEAMKRYISIIEDTTASDFATIEIVHGPGAISALVKAMMREAEAEADKTREALDSDVGSRALSNRVKALYEAQQKLERYGEILGEAFKDSSECLDGIKQEVVVAMLSAD